VLSAEQVLRLLADSPVVMGLLDSGPCTLEHVSLRDKNGPDRRLDGCPCDRTLAGDEDGAELGGGQYVSSPRHTLADLVRDVSGTAE
jgi:hypothetical protein